MSTTIQERAAASTLVKKCSLEIANLLDAGTSPEQIENSAVSIGKVIARHFASLEPLRAAAERVLENKPMVECNNFHHSKADRHTGFDCPVCQRWCDAMDALQSVLTPAAAADGTMGKNL